jgi:hypothetical protein
MKALLFSIILFCLPGMISAQIFLPVNGTVKESVSGMPLPDCNVYISSRRCGTVTDSLGRFALNIPIDRYDEDLVMSYVGFETQRIKVSKAIYEENEIKMTTAIICLNEVVITGEPDRLALNHPDRPVEIEVNESGINVQGYLSQ